MWSPSRSARSRLAPRLTGGGPAPSVPPVEVRTEGVLGSTTVAPQHLRWSRQLRRVTHSTVVLAGALCVVLIVAMALFADSLAPRDPDDQNFDLIEARPGLQALFGTDRFGRDVLSRVIHGSRISLYVAITSISVAMVAGGALGLTAGYLGGGWDNVINRVLDVFFSIPGLLLSVGIAAMRGPGINSAVIAIAIVDVPLFARVLRGPVLAEREKEYVEAIRALGAARWVVALKHVLPNVVSPFVALLYLELLVVEFCFQTRFCQ